MTWSSQFLHTNPRKSILGRLHPYYRASEQLSGRKGTTQIQNRHTTFSIQVVTKIQKFQQYTYHTSLHEMHVPVSISLRRWLVTKQQPVWQKTMRKATEAKKLNQTDHEDIFNNMIQMAPKPLYLTKCYSCYKETFKLKQLLQFSLIVREIKTKFLCIFHATP